MGLIFSINAIPAADAERLIAGHLDVANNTIKSASFDKAWGGIHYLLSAASTSDVDEHDPKHFLVNGVLLEEISEHVAIHTAEQVADFAKVLSAHSDDELLQRFNPEEMNRLNVYGGPWNPSMKQYVGQFLPDLRDFLREAVLRNCGSITTIC
jgi:hypothetical protein